MKTIKKTLVLLLAAVMLFSAAACGSAPPAHTETPAEAGTDTPAVQPADNAAAEAIAAQLSLLFNDMSTWNLDKNGEQWQYIVTDLDHNGRLELIAAKNNPDDRTTNINVWEVNKDGNGLDACKVQLDADGAFPDIITENTDTYYTSASDDWVYFFYDNTLFEGGAKTVKCSVQLKDGELLVKEYAYEISETDENGKTTVTHQDLNGREIPAEAYNDAGMDGFVGSMRGSTNLDWFGMDEIADVTRLTGSYRVFTGEKTPPKPHVAPVPTPAPSSEPTPAPGPSTTPDYLTITKNPSHEYRTAGETAYFVAGANNYTYAQWTLVSPDGGEYTSQTFDWNFPNASVDGEYSTTLSIANVDVDMDGWGAYCTFYFNGQTARTSTACLSVQPQPTPPPGGQFSGTVKDFTYSTVYITLETGDDISVDRSICEEDGNIYSGAPCQAYYNGADSDPEFYYVYIEGEHNFGPIYGTMSGTVSGHSEGSLDITLQNGSAVSVSTDLMNLIGGVLKDGCSCMVYYQNYPSEEYIYQVDVYGAQEGTGLIIPDDPGSGSDGGHGTGFGF